VWLIFRCLRFKRLSEKVAITKLRFNPNLKQSYEFRYKFSLPTNASICYQKKYTFSRICIKVKSYPLWPRIIGHFDISKFSKNTKTAYNLTWGSTIHWDNKTELSINIDWKTDKQMTHVAVKYCFFFSRSKFSTRMQAHPLAHLT
jgi:hypothetical protein